MANFFSGLAGGFATGYDLGSDLRKRAQEKKLRTGLSDISGAALTPTPDGTGYTYLDQNFDRAPSNAEIQGLRYQRMGDLYTQYGDVDKGIALQEVAYNQREKALQERIQNAFYSGDVNTLVSVWDDINNGVNAKVVNTDNGVAVVAWDEGNPASERVVFEAPDQETLVSTLRQQVSPETARLLAKEEMEFTNKELDMRKKLQELQGTTPAETRQRVAMQRKALMDQLQLAKDAGDGAAAAALTDDLRVFDATVARAFNGGGISGGTDGTANENWKTRLIGTESSGNWKAANDSGAVGRLQFMPARLQDAKRALGIEFTTEQFINNPELQRKVEDWHFADIENNIRKAGLDRYIGQTINGVTVTMDGMRAVAHLGGFPGLQRHLQTNGQYNPHDGQNGKVGTHLSDYMAKHAGPVSRPRGDSGLAQSVGRSTARNANRVELTQADYDWAREETLSRTQQRMADYGGNLNPATKEAIVREVAAEVEAELYDQKRRMPYGEPATGIADPYTTADAFDKLFGSTPGGARTGGDF